MEEYLKVPTWFNGEENISYSFVESLVGSTVDNKIDICHLREIYITSREKFSNVVNELALRGFEFITIKGTNVLPQKKYEYSKYICVAENSNRFKCIDFEKIGVPNFIVLYNVCSDLFFNFIPLEGFKYLNALLEVELLEREFRRCGFEICGIDNTTSILECKSSVLDFAINKEFITREKEKSFVDNVSKEIENEGNLYQEIILAKLEFSIRALNVLKSLEVTTLDHLINLNVSRLENVRNCGRKTFDEINSFINVIPKYGLVRVNNVLNENVLSKGALEILHKNGVFWERSLLLLDKSQYIKFDITEEIIVNEIDKYKESIDTSELYELDNFLEREISNEDVELFEIDDRSIDMLCLSVRSRNALISYDILTIGKLLTLTEEEIFHIRNIGRKSAEEIIRKVNLLKESYDFKEHELAQTLGFKPNKIERYGHLAISNFNFGSETVLYSPEYFIINDLKNVIVSDLLNKGISQNELNELVKAFNSLESLADVFSGFVCDERVLNILKLRYEEGLTLEEISIKFDITRERVRQLIKKSVNKLKMYLAAKNFELLVKIFSNKRTAIFKTELVEIIGESSVIINILTNDDAEILNYYKPLDIFFYSADERENLIKDIAILIEGLEDAFLLYDVIDPVLQILERYDIHNLDIVSIEIMFIDYGFKKYGEYFFKNSMNNSVAMNLLFRDYIKTPLVFNDETYELLCNQSMDLLNYRLTESSRSLENCIRNLETIIMYGRRTYIHISNLEFDESIVYLLDEYLAAYILENRYIEKDCYYKKYLEIEKNKEVLPQSALYSILRYYLCDKYIFGRGNTMNIFSLENIDKGLLSNDNLLENYLVGVNGKAHKREIINGLGWNELKLNNTILNYKRFFALGDGYVRLMHNCIFSENEKNLLYPLIEAELEKGLLSVKNMHDDIKFSPELNHILIKYDIDNDLYFSNLLKMNFDILKGHSSILFHKESSYSTMQEFVIQNYPRFNKSELKNFISKIASEPLYFSILSSLINTDTYVEIEEDEYANVNIMKFEDDVYAAVLSFVNNRIGENEYIVLKQLSGYRQNLPRIPYKWNPYLIRYLIRHRGYRDIEKTYKDSRTNKLIMLKDSSSLRTLDELIHWLLKNRYSGNLHEFAVYEYLSALGILDIKENKMSRVLPAEIRSSDLFEIDSVGRITLR